MQKQKTQTQTAEEFKINGVVYARLLKGHRIGYGPIFNLSWNVGGKRNRRQFSDYAEAEREAWVVAENLYKGVGAITQFSVEDLTRIYEQIQRVGCLDNLVQAVDMFKDVEARGDTPFRQIAAKYISLLDDGRNKETMLSHFRVMQRLNPDLFNCAIGRITTEMLQDYARREDWSPVTQSNHLRSISTVFNYARNIGYFRGLVSPTAGVRLCKVENREKVWMKPAQLQELLYAAWDTDIDRVTYFAIMAWCGGRRSELEQHLRVRDIDLENKKLRLAGGKTGHRFMDIPDCCAAWLQAVKDIPDSILGDPARFNEKLLNRCDPLASIREQLSYEWKNNYLRHSFISHHVAKYRNVAETAHLAGNSVEVVNAHYRGLVDPPELAERYFSIYPRK